jgi:hypothetical protein
MRIAGHLGSLLLGVVLLVVLTHEQHMTLAALFFVVMVLGCMVLGTVSWLIRLVFRRA